MQTEYQKTHETPCIGNWACLNHCTELRRGCSPSYNSRLLLILKDKQSMLTAPYHLKARVNKIDFEFLKIDALIVSSFVCQTINKLYGDGAVYCMQKQTYGWVLTLVSITPVSQYNLIRGAQIKCSPAIKNFRVIQKWSSLLCISSFTTETQSLFLLKKGYKLIFF